MTDRIKTITVTLDCDYREDDAQPIIQAIRMIQGVLSADHSVLDPDMYYAKQQVKKELREKIAALWDETFK